MSNSVIIFDTTLRDGEQSPGATMSIKDKIDIALILQDLNVDVIEAGFAFASKEDFDSIHEIAQIVKNATICSLARAIEDDIVAAAKAIKKANNGRIHTFVATSDIHLKHKLKKTQEEVLEIIKKSVQCARNLCGDVEWSAEDATRTESGYLIRCVETAIKAGAKTINLPDTVGFATPIEYKKMFEDVIKNTSSNGVIFSTHCHNDLGLATANSLCGLQGGARQVECAINGIGERAGNAALEEIVMAIRVKKELGFVTNVNPTKISNASRLVSKATGFTIQPNKAIVGKNAFLHESGIHQDGMLKNKNTYEIIDKEEVGIKINPITLGRLSGKAALRDKLREFGCQPGDEELASMFNRFKQIAASKKFILDNDILDIINNSQGASAISTTIEFVSYKIIDFSNDSKTVCVTIKNNHQQQTDHSAGNGAIDAIFRAINKMVNINPVLESLTIDAISSGSDAVGVTNVVISYGGQSFASSGSDNDITSSAAKSYTSGINKILNSIKICPN